MGWREVVCLELYATADGPPKGALLAGAHSPGPAFLALELGVSILLFADFVIRLAVAGIDVR